MNDRYEFRAWLKNEKKMVKVSELRDIDTDIRSDQNVIYFDFEKQEYCNKGFDEVELMQYTGLKDKNGVKIFEGDIVRLYKEKEDEYNIWYERTDKLKVINFESGCFRFGCIEFDRYHRGKYELEVIGNIYETPELLGEEK